MRAEVIASVGAWGNVIQWKLIRVRSVCVLWWGQSKERILWPFWGKRLGGVGNWTGGKPLGCPEGFAKWETTLCCLAKEHGVNMYPLILSSCFSRAQQERFCQAYSVWGNGWFPFAKPQGISLPTGLLLWKSEKDFLCIKLKNPPVL